MTHAERQAALEAIASEISTCTRCRLHEGRTNAVPGEGNPSTEVVFVGEGPGRDEDAQGRPFVGESGKFLTRLIGSIGWRRDEVYITNVVKCRPPGNRDPQSDEIAACAQFLERQLDVLDPAVVVTLGRFSLGTFRPGERIGQAHGTRRPVAGRDGTDAFAMYHPAYAVRDKNNEPILFEDIAELPQTLVDVRRRRAGARAETEADAPSADTDTSADSDTPVGAGVAVGARHRGADDGEPAEARSRWDPAVPADKSAGPPDALPADQISLF